jgi:hypothetical protein
MASDGQPVQIPATSLVHGSQAPTTVKNQQGGKTVPQSGMDTHPVPSAAVSAAANEKTVTPPKSEVPAQVALLNKFLNDSGRPAQFLPSPDDKSIQEINPANGEVVAEYSAAEFPALARSVGISGAVVNERV